MLDLEDVIIHDLQKVLMYHYKTRWYKRETAYENARKTIEILRYYKGIVNQRILH